MARRTIRTTRSDRVAAGIRIALGVLFVMSGLMKLVVPSLGAAFVGQLEAANLPLQQLTVWIVPFIEVAVGGALLFGFYARMAALVVLPLMMVATYVHVVSDDPSLFPLQPERPFIPLMVMFLAAYVLAYGGGAGSADLRASSGE